jgi:translation elongation factor EF-Tu-like GTPase
MVPDYLPSHDNCPVIQGSALGGLNNDVWVQNFELMEAVDLD